MNLTIHPMKYEDAQQISRWTYQEPYSIYNLDDQYIDELLNGSYYSGYKNGNILMGYFCFGEAAQVPAGKPVGGYYQENMLDIGLGMRPDLCGQGKGFEFLQAGLLFARELFSNPRFRLTVAAFNQRAIQLYLKTGFRKSCSFFRELADEKREFWVMILD